MRYKIETTHNGAFYTITRLADGASIFLQGDDAVLFGDRIEGLPAGSEEEDRVCEDYDAVMQAG